MLKQLLFLCSVFCLMNINAQVANQPTPLEMCDDQIPDGITEFDLSLKNAEILGGQNPSDFTVTYYLTQIDSETQMNPLPLIYTNSINAQTLFVRVEEVSTGNFDSTTLTLRVNPNPTPQYPPNLMQCEDPINGGFASFDLTTNDLYIINSEVGVDVSYYTSQSDASFGANVINDPTNYVNSSSPQTLYARAEIVTTGCFTIVDFDIEVNPMPVAPNLEEDYLFCQGESLVIDSGVDPNNYTIQWEQNGFAIMDATNPTLTINQADIYSIILIDNVTNCMSITYTNVDEISCVDTDSDGVIDADEDLNSNGNLDDDDTDLDGIPNYLDDDDDGDNVDTIDEITNPNGRMALHSFIDTDLDTIENYLDNDDDGDLVLTIDEDYNNNGDPTDDDTNMNSVPDYLDADVALSVTDYIVSNFSLFPNPANDILNIKLNNISNANLRVYDIQGKLVIERSISNEQNLELNVSNLQSGLYFVKLNTSTKEMVKKLIIN